ncbi:hypothetical protein ACIGFK_27450 [Streptomyces sp. NPDC085524]|uniref:hypothetical protein n=1 Tax=unclassified Streptomyces TaxID=2593676 RepID=UPI0035DA7189
MHGPGLTPPQSGQQSGNGLQVSLRVLFVALTLLSCGFLAWAAMLKVAIVTRAPRNWILFVGTVVINIVCIAFVGSDDSPDGETGPSTNIAMITSLTTAIAVIAYFLYEDIRHYSAAGTPPAQGWYGQQSPAVTYPAATYPQQPGYGYPPQAPTPVPGQLQVPGVPPQAPDVPRIGQVRAELDELSELLRKQQDPNRPPHQGPTSFEDPHQ